MKMFQNYNEIELLHLMKNRDKFLQYVEQQFKSNLCYTPLEPFIWAIHFNIPKYQRLPLLENILHQSMTYIRNCYSFLPEKQILGKTYEILGIPTICGEPNKRFLNAYKRYKSYYPIKYPKYKKIPVLNNGNDHNSNNMKYDCSTPLDSNIKINNNCIKSTSIIDQERVSSTPIVSKTRLDFGINSSLIISPIRTPVKNEGFLIDAHVINNMQSSTRNDNISHTNQQLEQSLDMFEISGFDIIPSSSQKSFNNVQNTEVAKNTNNMQELMCFISNPKYIQAESDTSQSEINYISNTSEDSFGNETKYHIKNDTDTVITSFYFDDSKKKELKLKESLCQEKQNLTEKLEKNTFEHLNQNSLIDTPKKTECNIKQTHLDLESSINESWLRLKQSFCVNSFSELEKSVEIQIIKSNTWGKKTNEYKQYSMKLECNDSWEQFMNNCNMDIEFQNIDIESQNYRNKIGMSCTNFSQKESNNLSGPDKNNKYNMELNRSYTSSFIFSDDSILNSSNYFNINSNQSDHLNSIKHEFMKWSEDSFDANNYVNNIFEKKDSKSNENINISLTSLSNMSLSSISTMDD